MKSLDNANLYFDKIGTLQLQEGVVRLVKRISLENIRDRLTETNSNLQPIYNNSNFCATESNYSCIKNSPSIYKKWASVDRDFNLLLEMIDHSQVRAKRSVNVVGSAFKWLFGTMDHNDDVFLHKTIKNIHNTEDALKEVVEDEFEVLNATNKNIDRMQRDQEHMLKSFKSLQLQNAKDKVDIFDEMNKVKLQQVLLQGESIINSLEFLVTKIHNAILFAKMGVLDPFLVSPTEILNKINGRDVNFKIGSKDIESLVNKIPIAFVADLDSKNLYIMLKVPSAAQNKFNLFECFVLPKVEDSMVVSLVGTSKYFALSTDKTQYIQEDQIDCFITADNSYVCKNVIVRDVGVNPTCETNVFVKRTDDLCQYKKYLSDFDAHNKVKNGLILFTSKGLYMNITCKHGFASTQKLNGSNLISVPDQCELRSDKLVYSLFETSTDVALESEAPTITCCSPFFKYVPSIVKNDTAIPFYNLSSIRTIDSEVLNIDLHKLRMLGKTYLPQVISDNWSDWTVWAGILFGIFVILYIIFKFQHLIMFFSNRKRQVTQTVPLVRYTAALQQQEELIHSMENGGYKLKF